ncbi:hypothetical protein D3C78_624480 [compost metagenome]
MDITAAEQRCKDFLYSALVGALYFAHIVQFGIVKPVTGMAARQQTAVLVDHRHAIHCQLGHAGSYQVNDCADLPLAQFTARLQGQCDRCAGGFAVTGEHRVLGHHQMYSSMGHRPEGFDGTRQLTFQPTLVIEVFGKLADAKSLLVQQLEANTARFWQALLGQLQAQCIHPFGGHHDGMPTLAQPVRHATLVQFTNDLATISLTQVGEQHPVLRLLRPQQQPDQ